MPPRRGGFRHLIYLIDGTWLWPGSQNTLDVYSNIYRINTLLDADDDEGHAQIVHYARGLGAVDGIRRYTSGGFAYGIDELVADLYVNICSNYEKGDKLYFLGFSRGAVVARALTGLLSKGILEAQHINMFAHVWADYVGLGEVLEPGLREGPRAKSKIAEYKSLCSEINPTIEFLGVFDTVVGGHGLAAIAQKLRLRERKLELNVKNALQLLAIDETRSFFAPIMWTGIKEAAEPTSRHRNESPFLEQVWMPGVHADVGGAYAERFLGNVALLTMIDRLMARTVLSFDLAECRKYNEKPPADYLAHIHNEYTGLWRFFSPFPKSRCVDTQIHQFIHPFAKELSGRAVHYKKNEMHIPYALADEFGQLPIAQEFISGNF